MNKSFLLKSLFLIVLFAFNTSCFAQITIKVTSISQEISTNHEVYLAGNFNNWNPNDSKYQLEQKTKESYQFIFSPPTGTLEFKFTKGSWESVETDENGNDIANRSLNYDGTPISINVAIAGWKDELAPVLEKVSTAAKNVSIHSADFHIPQLNQKRKIWIYLPPDYEISGKKYPVLYMHDAQNLFDAKTSFSGEWNVDESLNELFHNGDEGIIVVGIENGGEFRIDEYTPWAHPEHGGGQGDKYIDFIVETLKPYVDSNFRTRADRLHTGIMGSSLGGLISFYAAIKHQDVFSKVGVFSPSFWFSDEVYELVDRIGKVYNMKLYLMGGELESDHLVDEINAMITTLQMAGFDESEIEMIIHKDGEHNEQYWSREFKDCYLWLFR